MAENEIIHVETNRFYLRDITEGDAADLYRLDSDPRVQIYLGNKTVKSIHEIHKMIQGIHRQYEKHGIGRWAVIQKDSGQFLGWAGLKKVMETVNGYSNHYDLGYRLLPEYWGQGVASECASASLIYGFTRLSLQVIYAAAHFENMASNRILVKNGFQETGQFEYFGAPQKWYQLDLNRWKKVSGIL
jgi:ribosomal-protein-alanine N-acetyltransferase